MKCALVEKEKAREDVETESFEYQKLVHVEHKNGFLKELWKAEFILQILMQDERFDVNKDVFKGTLIDINKIAAVRNGLTTKDADINIDADMTSLIDT
ncbi:hypothetical protein DEO72_LG8g2080 [Vigna unguiculata]|uniref:Uncharacterized protein n=1 Tax=Vigna unguiculata TaxID=3917 RepID=A0A4D6MVX1_VIGUN|nr:hypothetical protein DEO72_LG8g1495 [Vigna unguiculata]QCE04047.1 hypothetical protein DEO72_LG8g2080 [Vigna unguiculata]